MRSTAWTTRRCASAAAIIINRCVCYKRSLVATLSITLSNTRSDCHTGRPLTVRSLAVEGRLPPHKTRRTWREICRRRRRRQRRRPGFPWRAFPRRARQVQVRSAARDCSPPLLTATARYLSICLSDQFQKLFCTIQNRIDNRPCS